eukprot:Pompholyxophrys_punicea_v1_NODE_962_length_1094_cov_2.191530.p1 type:complete len:125 gc:universal NODE_962_length_1094_cov_2.191530:331-705(+)
MTTEARSSKFLEKAKRLVSSAKSESQASGDHMYKLNGNGSRIGNSRFNRLKVRRTKRRINKLESIFQVNQFSRVPVIPKRASFRIRQKCLTESKAFLTSTNTPAPSIYFHESEFELTRPFLNPN